VLCCLDRVMLVFALPRPSMSERSERPEAAPSGAPGAGATPALAGGGAPRHKLLAHLSKPGTSQMCVKEILQVREARRTSRCYSSAGAVPPPAREA
jgi:hypothetical protein